LNGLGGFSRIFLVPCRMKKEKSVKIRRIRPIRGQKNHV
jgi:hypothetical protein